MATGPRDPRGSDAGKLSTDDLRGCGGVPAPEAGDTPTEVPPTFPGEATTADPGDLPGVDGGTQHAPAATAGPDTAATGADEDGNEPLLGDEQEAFRTRWQQIQGDFSVTPAKRSALPTSWSRK